jgi:starch synthase (maltosyl-transferring)
VPLQRSAEPPRRIVVEHVWPQLDCGRWPAKASLGDAVDVWADIFRDGHEVLGAGIRYRKLGARRWREAPLLPVGSDCWHGQFRPDSCGLWEYSLLAWVDRIASWQRELARKVEAGQKDVKSELAEGALLLDVAELDVEAGLAAPAGDRSEVVESGPLRVDVDRERARFGSWYELFPRSFGGFAGVEKILPDLAELGFDVLYLPPIHPIGRVNRKGRNNALKAAKGDPGSPWAIGSDEGGHEAINPELGSLADFERLVGRAGELGIDICLDFAIQCAPDHPWLREHPEWFQHRPDGTLKYAENPPKKYQDIHNVDWDCEDWRGLWEALRDIVLLWVERGVTVFRVDNPHTKPLPFWEWLIREVRTAHPDVVFLAEAFTAPAMMRALAKAGFNQSYTYFTWKNSKAELVEYVTELARTEMRHYSRPNFFVNTPDILHEYLQKGGRPAFEARLILAATLSPSYGIYSGYENLERVPVREGSEEYLDSEKYELKKRRLDGELLGLVQTLNQARRAHPALQRLETVDFLETRSDELIAYSKSDGEDTVLVVCNLNPILPREGLVDVPAALGLGTSFRVRDLLDGKLYTWASGGNYVRLDPTERVAHVFEIAPAPEAKQP